MAISCWDKVLDGLPPMSLLDVPERCPRCAHGESWLDLVTLGVTAANVVLAHQNGLDVPPLELRSGRRVVDAS